MTIDHRRLSKTMSHALRHAPQQYGLTLDAEGWVAVDALLTALRAKPRFASVTQTDIEAMMVAAEKQRFAIEGDRIRAQYGHSVADKIAKTPTVPPEILYHGTSPRAATIIRQEGLKPMRRQYVHLSADLQTATTVGKRHDPNPIILHVRAADAHNAGIHFYTEPNGIWLAEPIPADYIAHYPD